MDGITHALVIVYELCLAMVLSNLLIALMTTTYEKVAANAELEWYWQFADLVLSAERTWLGEVLKTRQLYRLGDDYDQSGSLTVVENTVDGYNKRDTQKMPKPIDATRAAAGFGISADAISDAQPFALNSKEMVQ